ncbi:MULTISPECIES: type III pantothenate kinase [Prochlorococcus]|uniref:Type III pantothenate kinase n=1 Tax=Prochlorococcus marinus (strain SARG / CCMP1375 / SS120) TaxID=167539 RepID=Q7VEB9_PROMA|nr:MULTISPECIES: type III pantothenate kinase [Prochlorococcus]AAP99140.1 Predicted transcriptional regulator [Prochlorococcus marinus subsp. marinus str. CCMP1375]
MKHQKYCLLIGNSRWHWAIQKQEQWSFSHTDPNPKQLKKLKNHLWKWAAVGPIPSSINLETKRCIGIKDVPLLKLTDWIGIDRALGGWAAFKQAKSQNLHSKGILLADAGTVLSLTRITANGEFAGGQLIAGLKLQRSSMAKGAQKLKPVCTDNLPANQFPISTEAAMLKGSFQALLGSIIEAQKDSNLPLWICGGDSEILFNHLINRQIDVYHRPNLVLEGMIDIDLPSIPKPNPEQSDQPYWQP